MFVGAEKRAASSVIQLAVGKPEVKLLSLENKSFKLYSAAVASILRVREPTGQMTRQALKLN